MGFLRWLIFLFNLFDHFRDEKGENKEAHREENFEGEQLPPVTACPNFFESSYGKSKDECPHNDAQARAKEIIPEPDLGQSHAEVHSGEGEINQS